MLIVVIGTARRYGLEDDLNLTGDQFQLVVSILFVTYCVSRQPISIIMLTIPALQSSLRYGSQEILAGSMACNLDDLIGSGGFPFCLRTELCSTAGMSLASGSLRSRPFP